MQSGLASVLPIASLKLLLIPLGILGALLFLLLLGALALAIAMSVISAMSWLLRLPFKEASYPLQRGPTRERKQ